MLRRGIKERIWRYINALTVGSVGPFYVFWFLVCRLLFPLLVPGGTENGWYSILDKVYGHNNTETRMQPDIADNIIWARYTTPPPASNSDRKSTLFRCFFFSSPPSRIKTLSTPIPLHAAIQEATDAILYPSTMMQIPTVPLLTATAPKLIVVTGRSRRLAVENHQNELKELMGEHEHVGAEVRKTIGDVGTAFVVAVRDAFPFPYVLPFPYTCVPIRLAPPI